MTVVSSIPPTITFTFPTTAALLIVAIADIRILGTYGGARIPDQQP